MRLGIRRGQVVSVGDLELGIPGWIPDNDGHGAVPLQRTCPSLLLGCFHFTLVSRMEPEVPGIT